MTTLRLLPLLLALAATGAPRALEKPAPLATGADWPQLLGPNRDGVYAGSSLADSWPASGPPILWRRAVGSGFAGPAAAGGRVILFHRLGSEERIEALAAATGEPLWSFGYETSYRDGFGFDDGPRAVPTIAGGRVFTYGAEGVLTALDLATGRRLWSRATQRELGAGGGYFGAACSPLVDDGRVIVNVGGSDGAGVVAFDAADGTTLWTATDHEASYSSPIAATLHGLRRYLVFTREGLVDLEPASGRVRSFFRWRARIAASVNAATPLPVGERIFLSASYGTGATLLELTERGPRPLWESDRALTNHYATSVHHRGVLYGFHGRQEGAPALRAVQAATGEVAWSQERFGAGTLLLAGDRLLILTEAGELILAAASAEAFRPQARSRILRPTVRAYPALADGVFYARDGDELVAVDLRSAGS